MKLPAIVALSHPCKKFPTAAATATKTEPLILLLQIDKKISKQTTKEPKRVQTQIANQTSNKNQAFRENQYLHSDH